MADTFKGIITADGKKRQLPYGSVLETPVSDETLTKQGAFADSKIVGDKFAKVDEGIDSLKEDLGSLSKIEGISEEISLVGTPNTQTSANPQHAYIFNKLFNAGTKPIKISFIQVNAYESFYVRIYNKNGLLKKQYDLGNVTSGLNTIYLNTEYFDFDYYVGISSVLAYGGNGNTLEYYYSNRDFDPNSTPSSAKFSISISTKSDDEFNELSDRVNEIQNRIRNEIVSNDFTEDTSWQNIASFLLDRSIEYDGFITNIKLCLSTNDIVTIGIYDWDGKTLSASAFTLESKYDIYFENGIAKCIIPVKKGQYIAVISESNAKYFTKWTRNSEGIPFVYFQSVDSDGIPEMTTRYNNVVGIQYTLSSDSLELNFYTLSDELDEYNTIKLKDKTIFLGGDSRSSNDYDFYGDTLRKKANANVLVQGASGWMTKHIASNTYFERLNNINHDFAIFLVGGDDIGASGTVGTFDVNSINGKNGEPVVSESDISTDFFTGSGSEPNYDDGNHQSDYFIVAVDHIVRKYKSMFYDWKTLNNGHKPKLIMCTDIPQKRSGGESTWNLKENWERKRNAIIECCEKNNVVCLDLYALCNFDMSYEPEWSSPTDKVNNNGLYFMDGLHPNEYGIDIITSLEVDMLRKYITIN